MLEDLFAEIEKSHTFELTDDPSEIDRFEKSCGYELPVDLKEFYRRYKTVSLFESEYVTLYRFVLVAEMKLTAFDIYGDDCPPNLIYPKTWFTVCDLQDSNYIAVDLESEKHNQWNYIDCFHETYATPGWCKVIAKSFRELLERGLRSNGEQLYWIHKDFHGYGDGLEITPETAIHRVEPEKSIDYLEVVNAGWSVAFVKHGQYYGKFFVDRDYGDKVKAFQAAKLYLEENNQ